MDVPVTPPWGDTPTTVVQLRSGRELNARYRIIATLDEHPDPFPVHVYRVYDVLRDVECVAKVLSFAVDREHALDRSYERFLREIEVLRSLANPYIVPILDEGRSDRYAWIIMPYYPHGTLKNALDRRGHQPLPVVESCAYTIQIARLLALAHARDIIHRDVKPSNLLVDQTGDLVLTDFGIAHILHRDHLTRQNVAVGTPECMAPEQLQMRAFPEQEIIDARTDIYQLACTLYWMLAGQPVFVGQTPEATALAHLHYPPKPLDKMNKAVNPALALIVGTGLAKWPEERWQTMDAFADMLGPFVEGV